MKVLLVVDGSSYSDAATRMLRALHLHSDAEVIVMTVVPEHTFLGGITLSKFHGTTTLKDTQQYKALEMVRSSAKALSDIRPRIETVVRWGNPAAEILREVESSGAALVVMGAKGLTDPLVFRLGSVTQTVMKHAKASVLLVREKNAINRRGLPARNKTAAINRVLLATDGSKYSDAVTKFLLDLPLPRHSQVIVMTALQSHLAAWMKTPTLDLQTNQELLAKLQEAEENEARTVTDRTEKQFQSKRYHTASIVKRGGAAESILAVAKEYSPEIIAIGSRGLTGIESLLLGSVAERIARNANCSVLIGRAAK